MKLFFALFVAALLFTNSIIAQQNTNGISSNMLKDMHDKFVKSNSTALENAIWNNNIKKLAKSRYTNGSEDTYFSNTVKTKGITNQKKSGRCWLFTGLNVLRPVVINKFNMTDFQFSQSYLFFYDQLEKANLFLEGIINTASKPLKDKRVDWLLKNPIGDGGQWTGIVDLVSKYGLVPSDVMPESYQANNTSNMSKLLRMKLREDALFLRRMYANKEKGKALERKKVEMLSDIYHILALSLGEPPHNFEWRYKDADGKISPLKSYTPQSFYKEFVGVDLSDYVMFMNDPSRPYNKLYEIDYDRHTIDGHNWKYINLDINTIKQFAKASILDNQAMYFSCDVGKQLDSKDGYLDLNNYNYSALMGVSFTMDKKQRIITHASGSSHGMTLVGVDINANGKINKWLLENSWGHTGFDNGHLILGDGWFNEYMFRLVIKKKYISTEVLKILDQKPTILPPWDPMFSPEK